MNSNIPKIGIIARVCKSMGMSVELANVVQDWANAALVSSLVIGVVSTWAIIITGKVKEEQLTRDLAGAALKAEVAVADAARANARAAEANRAAEQERLARVKIEQMLAPRRIPGSEYPRLIAGIRQFAGQQFEMASYQDSQESVVLVMEIIMILTHAEWRGLKAREMLFGALVMGIVIDFSPDEAAKLEPPAKALVDSLLSVGIAATAAPNAEMAGFPDRIRIKVGRKP